MSTDVSNGQAGNSDLGQAYRSHSDWLLRVLRARYGADDAEDLAHEAWVRVGRNDLGTIRHPRAMLLRIATNYFLNRQARRQHASRYQDEMGGVGLFACQPTQIDGVLFRQVIVGLPQPLRDVFVLSRLGGLTNVQIAEQLKISPKSGYQPDARSPAGAGGLTQLMPATAAELGVTDRFDPEANLRGGADYLARQILRFGDLRLALAAYNAGPGRVARLGRIPDIEETRNYVALVVDCYLALSAGRSIRHASQCRAAGAQP